MNRGLQGRDNPRLALRAGGFRPFRAGRFGGFVFLGLQPKLSHVGLAARRVQDVMPNPASPPLNLPDAISDSRFLGCSVRRSPPAFAPMARFFQAAE